MTQTDFLARVGGSIKRRYKSQDWHDVEVKDEKYAYYYFDLMNHGYEYRF
jgi:hypothetical protein